MQIKSMSKVSTSQTSRGTLQDVTIAFSSPVINVSRSWVRVADISTSMLAAAQGVEIISSLERSGVKWAYEQTPRAYRCTNPRLTCNSAQQTLTSHATCNTAPSSTARVDHRFGRSLKRELRTDDVSASASTDEFGHMTVAQKKIHILSHATQNKLSFICRCPSMLLLVARCSGLIPFGYRQKGPKFFCIRQGQGVIKSSFRATATNSRSLHSRDGGSRGELCA
jgi:hypothetical protein